MAGGPESKASARRLAAREREIKALELRKAGATYVQIAEALGISRAGAHKVVLRALARLEKEAGEEAEHLRRLEIERLDAMLLAIWPHVKKGSLGAIDRAIRIMERRAKLLGLDAPTKADIQGEQVIRIIEEVSEDDA